MRNDRTILGLFTKLKIQLLKSNIELQTFSLIEIDQYGNKIETRKLDPKNVALFSLKIEMVKTLANLERCLLPIKSVHAD